MSLLTTGVAVAVKATMGTLNVQNGKQERVILCQSKYTLNFFVYSEMSLLFQTVWPEYQVRFAFLCNKLLQT